MSCFVIAVLPSSASCASVATSPVQAISPAGALASGRVLSGRPPGAVWVCASYSAVNISRSAIPRRAISLVDGGRCSGAGARRSDAPAGAASDK